MNIEQLIEILHIEKYHKIWMKCKITEIKLFKQSHLLRVSMVSDDTWPFLMYRDVCDGFENMSKCTCELNLMASNQNFTSTDVASYLRYFADKEHDLQLFLQTHPYVNAKEKLIVFKFKNELIHKANDKLSLVARYLGKAGITYKIVVQENVAVVEDNSHVAIQVAENKQSNKSFGFIAPEKTQNQCYIYHPLNEIQFPENGIQIRGKVFNIEESEIRKKGTIIVSYYITDYTDSLIVKCFEGKTFDRDFLRSIKVGDDIICNGNVQEDSFAHEISMIANEIVKKQIFFERQDDAQEKRIELHCHTKMSEMDAVCDAGDVVKLAYKFGHKAVAITDHMNVQGFPAAQIAWKDITKKIKAKREELTEKGEDPSIIPDFKVIYGIEMNMVDPILDICVQADNRLMRDATYCVFDLETTGLSSRYDDIIEFGAVIMKDGEVKEKFDFFVKPNQEIPKFIEEKTHITNDDVKDAITIEEALVKILGIMEGKVLVAHNAKFDVGFMNAKLEEYGYPLLTNPIIDTLDLARAMLDKKRSYTLGSVCSHYKVDYDGESAHRADYDADVLAQVFYLMMLEIRKNNCETLIDLQNYQDDTSFKKVRKKHVTLLVKNKEGLKNLFKLVSLSNVQYLVTSGSGGEETAAEPRITREKISELREGLLVGSSCQNGEIFELAINKTKRELMEALDFYDYIEIQPLSCYSNLLVSHSIRDEARLELALKNLIEACKEKGKMIIASGDVHYLNPEDKIFRDVYISAKGIGGVIHPLYFRSPEIRLNNQNPDQFFRTTNEMFEGYPYLSHEEASEYIINNPNKIYDMVEIVKPMHVDLFPPTIEGDKENLEKMCYENAKKQYGDPLPEIVEARLKRELSSIIGNGYAVIYYVAHLLVKKSNDDGYIVGSRGSVGSSFVATMSGITEVNPLAPHYYCPHCQYSEWFTDGSVASGYDLEDKVCPVCGHKMKGDGHDIPFETFLGFNGDKVPDIDLNFSDEYQANAHAFTKVIFGEDNVLRAGTIAGVAEKTAYGYVKGYIEDMNLPPKRNSEIVRLAKGCQDVKRTTGQHPGGIIVIPQYMDVHDFTPIQCPANNLESAWKTSHFDFHAIHDNVLKLDILGHVDPTALKMFSHFMETDPEFPKNFTLKDIPMNDKDVISLFYSTDALCMDTTNYPEKTGAVGLPEFGTKFVRGMLEQTQPHSFAELVQISGLSHGTDVWLNNAEELIRNGTCVLSEVIGCRDDIMVYLLHHGLEPKMAFTIMESVRKGKGLKPEMKDAMIANNIPDYYIDSCLKIKYMFPKAHAVAYVLSALRIAWFKVHWPHYYYSVYFSTRCDAYDIEVMSGGLQVVRAKMDNIQYRLNNPELKKDVTAKEIALYSTLEVVLEMYLRGYSMSGVDLNLSLATRFRWHPDNKHVIVPPFNVIDGLGDAVAETIVAARDEHPFISQEDLSNRSRISGTLLKKLEDLGSLKGLQKENQLSLF